ncbi:epidermal retinol dehydrogenase 2-like isoform X2 [Hirundo rustica]|uniref:epidermal retinol dehydrogenase 2-like isoform X2 n=1 Tax=Hirundo rustica TaxID=43150 RepID=UPI001A94EE24|nr:epidermal retinol dehydrogenase 2-like isoform X2 [Hirundo rustica]
MNFFLETLKLIVLLIYYLLESLVFLVVPGRKKNVSGEIVLITGAGSGIGRLLAIKFASLGATVVLWDINQEGLNSTVRLARENGAGRVHSYICDCSKTQDVYRVADQTYKAFLPAMVAANHGHLVCIASCAGFLGISHISDYCASKFAALGFAESIDMEMRALRKTGIKTTIVCPYVINTGMFDGVKAKWPRVLPILDPEYVAERIISAVRQNQEMLFIPRIFYFLYFFRSFLPVKAAVLLLDYFGGMEIMSTFKGRPKKE